jgi:hypothetical protein
MSDTEKRVVICDTVLRTLFFGVLFISLGAIKLESCPAEVNLPIYALVSGCVLIIAVPIFICDQFFKSWQWSVLNFVFGLVFGVFELCGLYWTFNIYEHALIQDENHLFCDWMLYSAMFWSFVVKIALGCFKLVSLVFLCFVVHA